MSINSCSEEEEEDIEKKNEKDPILKKKSTTKHVTKSGKARFDKLFLRRFTFLLLQKFQIFSPVHGLLFFAILILSVCSSLSTYRLFYVHSYFISYFVDMNWNECWKCTLTIFLLSIAISITDLFIRGDGILILFLSYFFRKRLTTDLLKGYFENNNYYVLINLKKIDNVDQRLHADCKDLCYTFAKVYTESILYLTQMISGIIVLIIIPAPWLIIPCLLVPSFFIFIYILLLSPISKQIYRRDMQEGNFRLVHNRILEYGESLSFYPHSSESEHQKAETVFKKLIKTQFWLSFRLFFLSLYNNFSLWTPPFIVLIVIFIMVFTECSPFSKNKNNFDLTLTIVWTYLTAQGCVESVSRLLSLSSPLARVIGNTHRVAEVFDKLEEIEKERNERSYQHITDPNQIRFENVTISTPRNDVLLRNVNLVIEKGKSTCIRGPSGIGKSSITRVLAGIWKFDGKLSRPKKMMFVTQKPPILIPGSLYDNILYPRNTSSEKNIKEEEEKKEDLDKIIETFGLESVLEKSKKLENWHMKCSLGQQQTIAMARVLQHSPKFVVLDECTNTVSERIERIFYEEMKKRRIIFLSISHRRSVNKFHDRIMEIKRSGEYSIREQIMNIESEGEDIIDDIIWRKESEYDVNEEEEEIKERLSFVINNKKKPKSDFDYSEEFRENGFILKTLDFLICCCCFRFCRRSMMFLCKKILIKNCCMCVFCFFIVFFSMICGLFFLPLMNLVGTLCTLDLKTSLILAGVIFLCLLIVSFSNSCNDFMFSIQGILFRSNVTRFLHSKYFQKKVFYRLCQFNRNLDCVDQRICRDIDLFTNGFQFGGYGGGLSLLGKIFSFSVSMIVIILFVQGMMFGYVLPLLTISIFLICLPIQFCLLICISTWRNRQQKFEGFFRNSLTRQTFHAEEIELSQGKKHEEEIVVGNFQSALFNQLQLSIFLSFNSVFALFSQHLSFSSSFVFLILSVRWGVLKAQFLGESILVAYVLTNSMFVVLLVQRFLHLVQSLGGVGQILGTFQRVSKLIEQVEKERMNVIREVEIEEKKGKRIVIDDPTKDSHLISTFMLTCKTPKGDRTLFKNLSFTVNKAENMLLTGPTGTGKTCLARILADLWNTYDGTIQCPPPSDIMFLPPKPYMCFGTLRSQIIYPHSETNKSDDELQEILEHVNLGYLIDRLGSLSKIKEWATLLSSGEQERISLCRLIYHKPSFAVIIKGTRSLDEANLDMLYRVCRSHSITYLSIGDRNKLLKYHNVNLVFQSDGGWKVFRKEKTFLKE